MINKHSGLALGAHDVYVNVVGGLRVAETSVDLAIALAAVSSFRNKPIGPDAVAFGELGLSGEVRPCVNGAERIRAAAKLGFRRAVVPAANYPREGVPGMEIMPVATLSHALDWLDGLEAPG